MIYNKLNLNINETSTCILKFVQNIYRMILSPQQNINNDFKFVSLIKILLLDDYSMDNVFLNLLQFSYDFFFRLLTINMNGMFAYGDHYSACKNIMLTHIFQRTYVCLIQKELFKI